MPLRLMISLGATSLTYEKWIRLACEYEAHHRLNIFSPLYHGLFLNIKSIKSCYHYIATMLGVE